MLAKRFTIWFCLATFIGGGLIVPAAHWHVHDPHCGHHVSQGPELSVGETSPASKTTATTPQTCGHSHHGHTHPPTGNQPTAAPSTDVPSVADIAHTHGPDAPAAPAEDPHSDGHCVICDLSSASAQLTAPVGLTAQSALILLLKGAPAPLLRGTTSCMPPQRGPPALS